MVNSTARKPKIHFKYAGIRQALRVVDDVADIERIARMRLSLELCAHPKTIKALGHEFPNRSLILGMDGDGVVGTTAAITLRPIITQDKAFILALRSMGVEVRKLVEGGKNLD